MDIRVKNTINKTFTPWPTGNNVSVKENWIRRDMKLHFLLSRQFIDIQSKGIYTRLLIIVGPDCPECISALPKTYTIQIAPLPSVWYITGCFLVSFFLCKSTARHLPTRNISTINKTFQMRYYMKFYLKGHQKYKQSNFWLSKYAWYSRPFLVLLTSTCCNSDAPWGTPLWSTSFERSY